MSTRVKRRLLVTAAITLVAAAFAACAVSGVDDQGLMLLLPTLLGAGWLLLQGPAEHVLLRWARGRCPISQQPEERRAVTWSNHVLVPRGGLLIASSMAVRPPPALTRARAR